MSRGLFERLLHKHASPVDIEEQQQTSDDIEPAMQVELATDDERPLDSLALDNSATDEIEHFVDPSEVTAPAEQASLETMDTEEAIASEVIASEGIDNELASEDVEDEERKQGNAMSALLASDSAPEIKKRALRSLFFSGQFSEVDELNDYHQDFSQIKPLSSEVASKLRHWTTEKANQLSEDLIEPSTADASNGVLTEDNQPNVDKEPSLSEEREVELTLEDEASSSQLVKEEYQEQDASDEIADNEPMTKQNKH
ncbi:hypothetical protein VHA01S_018_01040 [Vibrio halioticoli NBRC 102217]|uniref:DUF3306 domain-containing protein n=1 Tax=Vibrio halioticoli NBRC 102217 TaxID=1219072 RepID=V5FHH9_9VIBR|nr:DUF3306 domain-containing protein [Vibrio halioticoli]GAD89316.1 hypothetical protein VHA01S_018_01040 [Vibrio halioticoli NBRC 102217]